ncbi:MAG TPA: Ni/Fe hydrogenase subunit alpha [Candidatus Polarisedimenticolaceae bacterium]|nr:Ni/Fe hydrogenase subunit alpha [Candidatus Polarisedimenticolaceae bacterium]
MSRIIEVEHLGRVEGHGAFTVILDGPQVARVEFRVFEGLRLFERLVLGHLFDEVPAIVSRVCAICSHAHAIAAVTAVEDALGVRVTPRTLRLRELALHGGNIESHALHAFALALPDFLHLPGLAELAQQQPEATVLGLRLKKLGNTIQEVVGGRAVHPVTYVPGGFSAEPSREALIDLHRKLTAALDDCEHAVTVWSAVPLPQTGRAPIRCAALVTEGEDFLRGSALRLSDGTTLPLGAYRELAGEFAVPHAHAKHTAHAGRAYMLGALARVTVNGVPGGRAGEAAARLGFRVPSQDVLANNLAQVVEIVRSVERARSLVTELLAEREGSALAGPVRPRAGEGVAALEAPRGILFHRYVLDDKGTVTDADVITPTGQNLGHAEERLRLTAASLHGLPDAELTLRLEAVCRAYDPCLSCSVHVVRAG